MERIDVFKSDVDMKLREQFEFKISNKCKKPAIWFRLRNKEVTILPIPLFESLWDCNKRRRLSQGIDAHFQIFKDKIFGYYYDDSCGSYCIEYERNVFINSAINALTRLCKYLIKDKETYYTSFTKETAEQMLIDLQQIVIPKNYSMVFDDEVQEEDFSFRFIEPYSCDTSYELKIGNRTYVSNLSDWSTNFNLIRNEIEAFVYNPWKENADIQLFFEDSPTILRLKMKNLFWNKEVLSVMLTPDEFSCRPTLFGWCKPRQLIRSLYMGLLELPTINTDYFNDNIDGEWNCLRVKLYNQLQSNDIENYIKGIKEIEDCSFRNRFMCSVEEMLEDYNTLKSSLNELSL